MADKPNHDEPAAKILDGLADYIENAPGEALLEDARDAGRDPEQMAAQVKNVLMRAVKNHQQRELLRARQAYEREVAAMRTRRIELPAKPETRRNWLAAVLAQRPQMQLAVTMQNRNFSELTNEDVEAHLRKLEMLGILKDVELPEDNG